MQWIERQRAFLDFTLAALWRRKGKNISLLVVYSLMVFLISSVLFFAGALRREAEALLAQAPEIIVQRTVGGRHDPIPLAYQERLKAIRGVLAVRARLWGYYFHPATQANYTLMVADEAGPEAPPGVVIGSGVERTWGTILGNRLFFRAHDGEAIALPIRRSFADDSELVTADLILMGEPAFRKISGTPAGFATDLALTVRNLRECRTIGAKIVEMLPDTRPILREEILRTYTALFDWRSGYIVVLLFGSVLAFFIFAWDKATGLSAEERSEIGVLKGLGWDTADILFMKFWEGSVISLSAFLIGAIGAYLHVFLAAAPLFQHALKGWATLYPRFKPYPAVDGFQLAILFFLTVVPYALVTLVPAWKFSVTDPDTVMRLT